MHTASREDALLTAAAEAPPPPLHTSAEARLPHSRRAERVRRASSASASPSPLHRSASVSSRTAADSILSVTRPA